MAVLYPQKPTSVGCVEISALCEKSELSYRARPCSQAVVGAIAWFRQHGYLKARF